MATCSPPEQWRPLLVWQPKNLTLRTPTRSTKTHCSHPIVNICIPITEQLYAYSIWGDFSVKPILTLTMLVACLSHWTAGFVISFCHHDPVNLGNWNVRDPFFVCNTTRAKDIWCKSLKHLTCWWHWVYPGSTQGNQGSLFIDKSTDGIRRTWGSIGKSNKDI